MTAEYGAATQLEKIDMLDFADVVAINKFDKRGSLDALRDVRKQYKRNHSLFEANDEMPSTARSPRSSTTRHEPPLPALMDVLAEKTGGPTAPRRSS